MKPKPLILEPGGYYKIQFNEGKIEVDRIEDDMVYIPELGWRSAKVRLDELYAELECNREIVSDPNDADNYDHEIDPNTNGRNGDFA